MTPRDALADGRLTDAIVSQEAAVRGEADDAAGHLFLFELYTLAGRLTDARDQLHAVDSHDPNWPASRGGFLRLLRAEHRRRRGGKPLFLVDPPTHARRRWNAVRALREGDADAAATWIDRADAVSPCPYLTGHVDGREFEGLRDTDDRFASVLEVYLGGEYAWVPLEYLRRLTLDPPAGVLDAAVRPAQVALAGGSELRVLVPLVYPNSAGAGDEFALGREADWPETPGGLACGVGARILMVGEEELPLGDCRQLDLLQGR
jgi:type VI secretion system protein ImpE